MATPTLRQRLAPYAPLAIRLGLGLIFLWSGTLKLVGSENALGICTNRVEAVNLVESITWLPFDPDKFVLVQSYLELLLGLVLVVGFRLRTAAGLSTLVLLAFFAVIDFDLVWKNMGLLGAALALVVLEPDPWVLDRWLARYRQERQPA